MRRAGPRSTMAILVLGFQLGSAAQGRAADATSKQSVPEPARSDSASATAAPAHFERPAYQFLRQNEDWSVLADWPEAQRDDLFDPVKYVPLDKDGQVWATFAGSSRAQLQSWFDYGFGTPSPDDDTFVLGRMRLDADVHFGSSVRAFVEIKSALSTDRDLPGGKRTMDVDDIALQQAFVDLRMPVAADTSLTLRLGRREFEYGRYRLVSPLPWGNSLRTWDGASLHLANESGFVDAFWSLYAPVRKYEFNKPDEDQQFFGVYASGKPGVPGMLVELYALGLVRNGSYTVNGTTGNDDRYTLGTRVVAPLGTRALTLEVEGAYQLGRVGHADVSAYMVAVELAAQVPDAWAKPRLALGFDYASGDHSAGGDVQTFDQLYPLGHPYFGIMDFIGRQNVIDASSSLTVHPLSATTLQVAGYVFRRAERADALYNAGGFVVRPGAPGTSLDVGQEIDVVLIQRFGRHVTTEIGYGHFFPGTFIEQTGSHQGMHFFYAELALVF